MDYCGGHEPAGNPRRMDRDLKPTQCAPALSELEEPNACISFARPGPWNRLATSTARSCLSHLLHLREYFFGVPVGLDVLEDVLNLPFWTDEKRRTRNPHHLPAIHVFLFDHVELVGDLLVGIGKKRVRELLFFFKLLLGGRFVRRNAEHYQAGSLQLCICIAEPASLNGSTRCVRLRVEEQHHRLAPELLQ